MSSNVSKNPNEIIRNFASSNTIVRAFSIGVLKLERNIRSFKTCCKMGKNHDESKDLRSFARVGRVTTGEKRLILSKDAAVGIKTWGRIDFLTHFCGWTLVRN